MLSTHWRIIALFFTHALAAGAIHTRIPDLQQLIGLTEGQLGLVLIGQPLGALSMFLFSSAIVERFGPRRMILWLLPIVVITAALATVLLNPITLFVLLALNGVGFSLTNIAMNVEADRVEAATSARVMNTCHGAWSVGFLLTSLLGATMRGLHVAPAIHLWALAPVLIGLIAFVVLPMPNMPPRPHTDGAVKKLAWPTWATMGLVAFGLGAGLTEGASRAWSIIYLRDAFDVAPFIESLALPALLLSMAGGRLVADRFIDRYGPVRVARSLSALAVLGMLAIVLAPNAYAALAGFLAVGIGICVLFPLMLSAAARLGDRPASQNVAATTLIFQLVNLGAPVLIGSVAEGFGVRMAFAMLIPLLVLTVTMAGQLRPKD
ncbi:MFS family permease [Devosia subaequoris]|uniref:MFS family permease n=1 Tax=Devosia subaequoris TaxID=395930 RepID=A0A7W6NCW2_9HYPH|nr:MFS transporter [Devosia subaequoris]MBB4053081.1 MFS family permease [Devosia subaequoris]MCP1210498.1 MFS transporter [Devosia subaequoris]